MHIHILGICGKFMAGLAIIAKEKGFTVSGSDQHTYGTLAKMLQSAGIEINEGYQKETLTNNADIVVIGNALSRGVPVIEHILNQNIPYTSGPQWLLENVLKDKWVLAVSGTHGKTTTSSMLTWILMEAGFDPGYLIGGDPLNFETCAHYSSSNFFVIEADEYDTAFFDKRSKFIHYHPKTLVINNLEFDHADIFTDLDDIKKQFSHLLRLVPSNGLIITPAADQNVQSLFSDNNWTPRETFDSKSANWQGQKKKADCSEFDIILNQKVVGVLNWNLVGEHNLQNALAAIAAARHIGIMPQVSVAALTKFQGVRKRLELKGSVREICVYDDFAHHPTAIATTLAGLRNKVGKQRIVAVLEFASNTMRAGHHKATICDALKDADIVVLLQPQASSWDLNTLRGEFTQPLCLSSSMADIIQFLTMTCQAGDHVVCMSNQSFDDIHTKLLQQLESI